MQGEAKRGRGRPMHDGVTRDKVIGVRLSASERRELAAAATAAKKALVVYVRDVALEQARRPR